MCFEGYPQSDWPYHFYLNGHELPQYSNQWALDRVPEYLAIGWEYEWDEFIGHWHISYLAHRMDRLGYIASEDPAIFTLCVQQVLLWYAEWQIVILGELLGWATSEKNAQQIYQSTTDGLAQMLDIVHKENRAFWTSGYEADREFLVKGMEKCELIQQPQYGEYLPPHIVERRGQIKLRTKFQVSDMRKLAQSGKLDKRMRRILNNVPGLSEGCWE